MIDFSVPHTMGILNVTPDSFSDGSLEQITNYELRITNLIEEGVDMIDVGGESTGPGSKEVSLDEEMRRVKPVIDWVSNGGPNRGSNGGSDSRSDGGLDGSRVLFSIDTYKAAVAEYALQHGFAMVNDVTALRGDPKMIEVLLKYKPYVILMYSKDSTPRTTRDDVKYDDVIGAIKGFLSVRIDTLLHAGFPKDRIIIDPGMGAFVSVDPQYSFEIIDRLAELKTLGYPICVGPSRKSFLGGDVKNRDQKSWDVAQQAIRNGASIVRMHTVQRL